MCGQVWMPAFAGMTLTFLSHPSFSTTHETSHSGPRLYEFQREPVALADRGVFVVILIF
jgi:hypothetical protein